MKQVGWLLGLVLAVAGSVHASLDDDELTTGQAFDSEAGNEYMVACTEAGIADGLSGDELDAYVKDCMDNPYAIYSEPAGEGG